MELIRDRFGSQEWTSNGERWLVVVQHDEHRPTHVFPVRTEAEARAMVARAAQLHDADNNEFLVHYCEPAEVVATVAGSRDYGWNGRMGRARSKASQRRERREMALAEGVNPDDPAAMQARDEAVDDEMLDDSGLLGRITGTSAGAATCSSDARRAARDGDQASDLDMLAKCEHKASVVLEMTNGEPA